MRTVAVLAPIGAGAILYLFRDGFSQAGNALVFVLVVVAVAASGDRVAGLLAALSTTAWFDFFCTSPYLSFTIHERDDVELAVLLVLVGVAVTELALWGLRQQEAALRRAAQLDSILALSTATQRGDADRSSHNATIARQVGATLGVERCDYVTGTIPRDAWVIERDGSASCQGRPVDLGGGFPTDRYVALPVLRGGAQLGYLRIASAAHVARPTPESLRTALLLADQLAT